MLALVANARFFVLLFCLFALERLLPLPACLISCLRRYFVPLLFTYVLQKFASLLFRVNFSLKFGCSFCLAVGLFGCLRRDYLLLGFLASCCLSALLFILLPAPKSAFKPAFDCTASCAFCASVILSCVLSGCGIGEVSIYFVVSYSTYAICCSPG